MKELYHNSHGAKPQAALEPKLLEKHRREPEAGPPESFSPPAGKHLAERHAQYLEDRGITLEVARAAGYWTATKSAEIPPAFGAQRRRHPTLVAPYYSPDGKTVSWQKHDDRPRTDSRGRLVKWASPKREKARTGLGVHPWMLKEVRSGTSPLWVCEGLTRAHALASLGIPAVSYAGCYAWQKDDEPLSCWEHVNLAGRLVYDVPDADGQTNWQVQETQAARVQFLESRGAKVLVVRVPEVGGDEHAGLDDYLAASSDLETLIRDAQPFVPVDVGRKRLKKDERLRLLQATKRTEVTRLPSRKDVECGAAKVARYMVEVSLPAHGKIRERGAVVHPSLRQISSGVRMGLNAVRNAIKCLEDSGFLERLAEPRARTSATSYLLLNPSGGGSALGEHIGTKGGVRKEGQECREKGQTSLSQRESSPRVHSMHVEAKSEKNAEKLPALRNSKLVHTWARKNGRRVVVDSDYVKRYGAKGEEILRYVIEGGRTDVSELREKFGSKTCRPGRFFKTWLEPMIDDGVLVGDAGSVEGSPDWMAALERVQERTDEPRDNRLQDERYAEQQRAFRQAKDLPTDPTPELAGPEKVREIVEAAEKRDHAARVEEQRRKVGMTPEVFLADTLQGVAGFGWRELRALWTAKGGKPEYLRRAVKHPYRFRRHDDGPLYVERIGTGPEPEHEPAPVVVLRETESRPEVADGMHHHGPLCNCEWCDTPLEPRYARAWMGA